MIEPFGNWHTFSFARFLAICSLPKSGEFRAVFGKFFFFWLSSLSSAGRDIVLDMKQKTTCEYHPQSVC